MEERTRFARESSSSFEEAGKLIVTDKDADDKIILHKFETSFQEMLNPYKRFCARVEKEHKVYKRSMVRLEKLYMEENASWFSKRKVRKARKVAKRNSDGYIKLLKEESNQAVNVNSLSVEYEGVAIEIATKRVKSFVECWSTCMSHHAEKYSGDARKVITTEQSLLSNVDSEKLVKLLAEFNKESLHIPAYQEFHGTVDVEKLLGYRPAVETIISGEKFGEENNVENRPMTPGDSYDRLYNPFCLKADEHGEGKNELVNDGLLTPADSYDKLHNPFCSNGNENGEDRKELERNKPMTPADSYDKLFNPFCSHEDEIKEEKEEGDKSLTTVNKSDERKLNRCGKAKVIHEHKKMKCLEMNIKPGIIQIESALRMEVAKMEERTRFARESSSSYEEAGKLIITDKYADDKIILHKFETSFQEMLNPYKRFCARVEKEHKVYKRSMVRLEKLYMEENASWFSKRKVRKARKVAKRNSDGYIKLLKDESNQAVNVNSLSVEYEGVAIEIATKRVKSFVECWSTCMSHHAEKSSGDAR
ncbi:hypothetical protein ACJMK2_003330 [Sinanodonta woodiana]|uniref:Uncharacterized protein n=1 Tax=Sinanodonta woodiana TaxID=1069815 RepID=A0ABD3Y153_SINWO